MIIEVKQFPESQEVMGKSGWFFISVDGGESDPIGNGAMARIVDIDYEPDGSIYTYGPIYTDDEVVPKIRIIDEESNNEKQKQTR